MPNVRRSPWPEATPASRSLLAVRVAGRSSRRRAHRRSRPRPGESDTPTWRIWASGQLDRESRPRLSRDGWQRLALACDVPGEACECAAGGEKQVPANPEDVSGGVDPQQLVDDPKRAVAGDVEGEQARRPDGAVVS